MEINITRAGYDASRSPSAEDGLSRLGEAAYDLVVLDIALPGMDGLELCRLLGRQYPDVAVIMVTARGTDLDKIRGLETGADDYLVKPFNPDELIARIRSVLRRTRKTDDTQPLSMDMAGRRVYREGREVHLTAKEFDLLRLLYTREGQVVPREELLREVWGGDFWGDEKTLDVHIRRLREKLEEDPSDPARIVTVWGVGFRFDA